MVILINPPVVKPCEPPAGITKLAGALSSAGIPYRLLDASLESIHHLLRQPGTSVDTWTGRALRGLETNLLALRSLSVYGNPDRYKRAVLDVNRVLQTSLTGLGHQISLGDYQDRLLSPVRSHDLLHTAENPEENPFYPYFSRRLAGMVEKDCPRLIGFSLNYLSQALSTFAMIGFLKRRYPSLPVALGGGLVTSWTRGPRWSDPFQGLVDHVVAGPGEVPLLSLCAAMGLGKRLNEEQGAGNGEPERRSPRVGSAIPPSFDGLPLRDYLSPYTVLPYSTSSGCFWSRCSFCPERAEGNPYCQRPQETVIADLQGLSSGTGAGLIHLTDNAVSPALMRRITVNPPGTAWYGFVRITEHLADPDFCRSLRASGCVMLKLGLESGDQKVLDDLNKGTDLKTASVALGTLKEAGIATYVYLLFGTPSETPEAARRTLGFVAAHHSHIDFLNLAIFNLPVASPETAILETDLFYEGDLSLYASFRHPLGWDRHSVRRFLDREFRRHPAVRSMMLRYPPIFTSNHAPFIAMARDRADPSVPPGDN